MWMNPIYLSSTWMIIQVKPFLQQRNLMFGIKTDSQSWLTIIPESVKVIIKILTEFSTFAFRLDNILAFWISFLLILDINYDFNEEKLKIMV